MGPNGEAQYYARDLGDAFRASCYDHYEYSYVVPGESLPAAAAHGDPVRRARSASLDARAAATPRGFASVGEIFDDEKNPGASGPSRCAP